MFKFHNLTGQCQIKIIISSIKDNEEFTVEEYCDGKYEYEVLSHGIHSLVEIHLELITLF